MVDPVMFGCEHCFCRNCVTQLRQPVCPACRHEFDAENDVKSAPVPIRGTLDSLKVYCCRNSCDWQGRRDQLLQHADNDCLYRLAKCRCGAEVEVHDWQNHWVNVCRVSKAEQAKAKVDALKPFFDDVHPGPEDVIKLNVRGTIIWTSRRTLCAQPESKIAIMFSGAYELKPLDDGSIFIDRDPKAILGLLEFLTHFANKQLVGGNESENKFWGVKSSWDEETMQFVDELFSHNMSKTGIEYDVIKQTFVSDNNNNVFPDFIKEVMKGKIWYMLRDSNRYTEVTKNGKQAWAAKPK